MRLTIHHHPSGDLAEAESMEAAVLAARTLIEDNAGGGFSGIHTEQGRRLDTVSLTATGAWLHSRGGKAEL
jgi:hypothetical protein